MTAVQVQLTRLLSALVLAVVLPIVPTAAASAEVSTVPDARGDLMTQDEVSGEYIAVPEATEFDVIQTRFRHRHHRVRVRMQFASLPRDTYGQYALRIRTSHRATAWVEVRMIPPSKNVSTDTSLRGRATECPVHHTFDYAHNVLVIGVSRRCLGWPRWVQVGAYARGGANGGTVEDDALRNRVVIEQLGHPTIGPPLSRGTW